MAIQKFLMLRYTDGAIEGPKTVTIDTTNENQVKLLRKINKKSTCTLFPTVNDDGELDMEAAKFLLTPGRRTTVGWTDEMVLTAHRLYVEENKEPHRIMLELYVKYNVETTEESVKKTLRQQINTEVELPDGLREKAKAKMPAKKEGEGKGRQEYSEEVKQAVLTDMENGMSGVEAGKKHGVHNSTANKWYRQKHGPRRP